MLLDVCVCVCVKQSQQATSYTATDDEAPPVDTMCEIDFSESVRKTNIIKEKMW